MTLDQDHRKYSNTSLEARNQEIFSRNFEASALEQSHAFTKQGLRPADHRLERIIWESVGILYVASPLGHTGYTPQQHIEWIGNQSRGLALDLAGHS